jgi:hypothetical protein
VFLCWVLRVVALENVGMGLGTGVSHLVEWMRDIVLIGLAQSPFLWETSQLTSQDKL